MWIVQLALRRKLTFIVVAMLIALFGGLTIARTPTDIFPNIDVPVVSVIWQFGGLPPNEMAGRMITICERAMTTTVNDIEHIDTQIYPGIGVINVYFQPGANAQAGVAQVTAINQTLIRIMPPGTTPPLIMQYSASSVPILQLGLSSQTLSQTQLYDFGTNFLRTQLSTVQGASVRTPYGGASRQIMVDIDIPALQAKGLSPADVINAVRT
jgi:multidrug efflux pump subunit AcrB